MKQNLLPELCCSSIASSACWKHLQTNLRLHPPIDNAAAVQRLPDQIFSFFSSHWMGRTGNPGRSTIEESEVFELLLSFNPFGDHVQAIFRARVIIVFTIWFFGVPSLEEIKERSIFKTSMGNCADRKAKSNQYQNHPWTIGCPVHGGA